MSLDFQCEFSLDLRELRGKLQDRNSLKLLMIVGGVGVLGFGGSLFVLGDESVVDLVEIGNDQVLVLIVVNDLTLQVRN